MVPEKLTNFLANPVFVLLGISTLLEDVLLICFSKSSFSSRWLAKCLIELMIKCFLSNSLENFRTNTICHLLTSFIYLGTLCWPIIQCLLQEEMDVQTAGDCGSSQPRVKPVPLISPASSGRVFTLAPPGKPVHIYVIFQRCPFMWNCLFYKVQIINKVVTKVYILK